ncbi:uncharacterized protein ACDP82_001045 [Pangshura tecta]
MRTGRLPEWILRVWCNSFLTPGRILQFVSWMAINLYLEGDTQIRCNSLPQYELLTLPNPKTIEEKEDQEEEMEMRDNGTKSASLPVQTAYRQQIVTEECFASLTRRSKKQRNEGFYFMVNCTSFQLDYMRI